MNATEGRLQSEIEQKEVQIQAFEGPTRSISVDGKAPSIPGGCMAEEVDICGSGDKCYLAFMRPAVVVPA